MEDETAVAEAPLGEATVIEAGATDASVDSQTFVDESVSVIVEAPTIEEEPVAETPAIEYAPAEHEHEHTHISECPECMAAVDMAVYDGLSDEEEALPEPEAVVEEAPEEEDVAPERTHIFHRKLWGA